MTAFDRRRFVSAAALAGGGALATPAIAQGAQILWRCPVFVPRSVDVVWNEAEDFVRQVSEATEGRFTIELSEPGEIVPPGPAMLDAVATGAVECAITLASFSAGKDPTYALATGLPFGMNARLQQSWHLRGGGAELLDDFFATRGLHAVPIGNSTAQMGGWFRKQITSRADLAGLRMRISGLGARVMAALGVAPVQMPPSEIVAALERGALDAAEFAAPYDDERFGFQRVAPFYYAPGWWEPNAMTHLFAHPPRWYDLPRPFQTILEVAAASSNQAVAAHFDRVNSQALRRLIAAGAQLRFFPADVMGAAYDAAFRLYDEIAAANPAFAKIYVHYRKYMEDNEFYHRVADNIYDNFVYGRRGRS